MLLALGVGGDKPGIDPLDALAHDELGGVKAVGADVRQRPGVTADLRIHPPVVVVVAVQPVLQVLTVDGEDTACVAGANPLPHLQQGDVVPIVEVDAVGHLMLPSQGHKLGSLPALHSQGLFGVDMLACLDGQLVERIVGGVGRADVHHLDIRIRDELLAAGIAAGNAELLRQILGEGVVCVRDGDDLGEGDAVDGLNVLTADKTDTDDTDGEGAHNQQSFRKEFESLRKTYICILPEAKSVVKKKLKFFCCPSIWTASVIQSKKRGEGAGWP